MIRALTNLMITPLASMIASNSHPGDDHPVLVLPGFLAGPPHTLLLRESIKQAGYQAFDWGMGFNFGFRLNTDDILSDTIDDLYAKTNKKVSLVGWSLGGIFAKAVAHRHPDKIKQVITLGSPHRTRPEWNTRTALFNILSDVPITNVPIDYMVRALTNPPVPMTCIYSKTDGVIKWRDAMCEETALSENTEVRGTHLGMTHNPNTIKVILDRLAT